MVIQYTVLFKIVHPKQVEPSVLTHDRTRIVLRYSHAFLDVQLQFNLLDIMTEMSLISTEPLHQEPMVQTILPKQVGPGVS